MKKLTVFLLLASSFSMAPVIRAQSAEEMASDCKDIVEAKVADGDTGIYVSHTFETGVCWGAFGTLQTAITVVPRSFPKDPPLLEVCASKGSTETQLVKIFMAYTGRHPEKLNQDFFFVAIAAFKEAFPCPNY
jgi:hypothetical protein